MACTTSPVVVVVPRMKSSSVSQVRRGTPAPVTADLAKQTMLDRVPFRASSGVVTHRHGYAEPIADFYLQAFFPGAHAAAIAATRVSQHQELVGTGRVGGSAVGLPPCGDGINGECWRVTRAAKIDEAAIGREVAHELFLLGVRADDRQPSRVNVARCTAM